MSKVSHENPVNFLHLTDYFPGANKTKETNKMLHFVLKIPKALNSFVLNVYSINFAVCIEMVGEQKTEILFYIIQIISLKISIDL